jgi:hypothetical protein
MRKFLPIAAMLLPVAAAAQDVPPPPADAPDIVVEAGRERANVYRRMLSRAVISGQYPRWHTPICVRVIGAQPAAAAAFRARIYAQARLIGAPVDERETCDSNIVVAWTDDGAGVAQRLYRRRARMMAEVPRPIRQRFLEGNDAVRWLPVAIIGAPNGGLVGTGDEAGIASDGAEPISLSVPTTRGYGASLIRQNSMATMAGVTVIIDADAATGVTLNALADYVALVTLTGMPMPTGDREMRQGESILALFDSPEGRGIREMTATDRAYLTELYALRPDRSARWYRGRMNRAVEEGMAADAEAAMAEE